MAPWSDNGIGKALRRELRPERDSTARGMEFRGAELEVGALMVLRKTLRFSSRRQGKCMVTVPL